MNTTNTMKNQAQTFNFSASLSSASHIIRVVTIDDQPWFVAVDACRVLDLDIARNGAPHYLTHLGDDEKTRQRVKGMRGSDAMLITESGLYKLIMRSDKPEAKPFQDWVTKVVLPAIRKDGAYIMGEEKVASGEMSEDELVLKAVGILQKKVERLTAERDLALSSALVPGLPYKVLYKPRGVVV